MHSDAAEGSIDDLNFIFDFSFEFNILMDLLK